MTPSIPRNLSIRSENVYVFLTPKSSGLAECSFDSPDEKFPIKVRKNNDTFEKKSN